VSHLGFCVLGLFAFNLQGAQGAVIQMVNHGLSTGALFLVVGMLYERRHTRMIADYGGVYKPMPVFGTFFTIIVLSSVALPGLNGFVGEFLILVGAFKAAKVFGVLAATGVVLAAIYLLWMYQRVMHGPIEHEENRKLPDLSVREIITLVPIVVLCFLIGLYPKPFLERTHATMNAIAIDAGRDPGAIEAPEEEEDDDDDEDDARADSVTRMARQTGGSPASPASSRGRRTDRPAAREAAALPPAQVIRYHPVEQEALPPATRREQQAANTSQPSPRGVPQ